MISLNTGATQNRIWPFFYILGMIFFLFFSILNMTFTTLLHVFELHDHWSFLLLYQNYILDIKSPLPSFRISLDAWMHENEPFMKVFFFCLNSMNFVSMIVQRTFCADDTFVSIDQNQKKIKNFVKLFIANSARIRLFSAMNSFNMSIVFVFLGFA